jgi:hypothetical protein
MTELEDDSKWRIPQPAESKREEWLVDLDDRTAVDATALAGANPFERKQDWRTTFRRTGSRGLAAAALAVAVLVLAWNLRPAASSSDAGFTVVSGTVHLTAPNPRTLKQQIVADLHAVGVDANGYEQLNTIGIDADLPRPLTADARAILDKHRIPAPPDGVLRVEISTAGN